MILPVSRREECASCRAEIHVCRMCRHYSSSRDRCLEERAEDQSDFTRANFCDYFAVSDRAWQGEESEANKPSAELNALFGGLSSIDATSQPSLDDLFDLPGSNDDEK